MPDTNRRLVHYRTDLLTEVRKADPEYDSESRNPIVYRVPGGRVFREVTAKSGPYAISEEES